MFLYFPHCCTPSDIEPLAPLANPPMIAPIVVARAPPCLPIIAPSMAPTVASPASAKTMSSSPLSSHSSVTVSQMSSQVSPIEFQVSSHQPFFMDGGISFPFLIVKALSF